MREQVGNSSFVPPKSQIVPVTPHVYTGDSRATQCFVALTTVTWPHYHCRMKFGKLELDPAVNPAVLDTVTWDPEQACADSRLRGAASTGSRSARPSRKEVHCPVTSPASCIADRGPSEERHVYSLCPAVGRPARFRRDRAERRPSRRTAARDPSERRRAAGGLRCRRRHRPQVRPDDPAGQGTSGDGGRAATGDRHADVHVGLAGHLAGDGRGQVRRQCDPELGARAEPARGRAGGPAAAEQLPVRLRHARRRAHRQHVRGALGGRRDRGAEERTRSPTTGRMRTISRSDAARADWSGPSASSTPPATTRSSRSMCRTSWITHWRRRTQLAQQVRAALDVVAELSAYIKSRQGRCSLRSGAEHR